MSAIIEEFYKKSHLYVEKGASIETIQKAENLLNLKFADEYIEYLLQFGAVSCGGHELTGFSEEDSLDVVKVTRKNIEKNINVKEPLYVVEETHIDGIVIWQSPAGAIFKTEYKEAPEKIFDSLTEYVSTFENKGDDEK